MATKERKHVAFKGLCRWAKILPGQEVAPYEPTDANRNDRHFEIEVECDETKFKALKKAGIPALTQLKEDDEGRTYIKLRKTKRRGDKDFGNLLVIDVDRNPIVDEVGNGSTVNCVAELADNPKGKGKVLRLKCVQVLDHVLFERNATAAYEDLLEGSPDADLDEASEDDDGLFI